MAFENETLPGEIISLVGVSTAKNEEFAKFGYSVINLRAAVFLSSQKKQ